MRGCDWLRWKLRVWGAKLHRNACQTMVGVARRNWEDDGGRWWDHYQMYLRLYNEAVEAVEQRVSERPR